MILAARLGLARLCVAVGLYAKRNGRKRLSRKWSQERFLIAQEKAVRSPALPREKIHAGAEPAHQGSTPGHEKQSMNLRPPFSSPCF
ncbi:hypothetical protein AUJ65_02845 [Candidatus Micrarchaeota archaeon CG1_02_51_15]|nr:MAG: hypothetical protein AUJ65_02845 [Candidatus Micrarchaeota archaeon CG1_02_51_15]